MEETPNQSDEDRLSVLPTSLLHHIASYLPMHKVVQTCVLSKWWRNFWCAVPTLHIKYDDLYFDDGVLEFEKFMNSVLLLRDGSDIQSLHLEMTCAKCDFPKLSEWIIYAVRHNVQLVSLHIDFDAFSSDEDRDPVYYSGIKLAPALFTCKVLRELTLCYNNSLNLPTSSCLPALKSLKIMYADLHDGLLEALLSATPSLKFLCLDQCGFESFLLTISALQLETLTMSGPSSTPLSTIVIAAPNLRSLKIDMFASVLSVVINAPNLVSFSLIIQTKTPALAKIKCNLLSLTDVVINMLNISVQSVLHLLGMVTNVRSLCLKSCDERSPKEVLLSPFVQELPIYLSLLSQLQKPFSNLKCLRIETLFSRAELILINNILEHSQIEDLVLVSTLVVQDWSKAIETERFVYDKEWSKYELFHLKLVEIRGFKGPENEMKMVKFLLENATILEKLVITVARCDNRSLADDEEIVKIGNKLVGYPRASSSVGILYLR